MNNQKHTSELLSDFESKLINRRSEVIETAHRFDTNDDKEKIIIEICINEANRIDKILKAIKKL